MDELRRDRLDRKVVETFFMESVANSLSTKSFNREVAFLGKELGDNLRGRLVLNKR